MKIWVIFLLLLVPSVYAVDVSIPELFVIEPRSIVEDSDGKEVYYYVGNKLIAVNDEYLYVDRLNSNINSRILPFGQELSNDERFSFTGKELDQDLYYFNARYYDSDLGKFVTVDPIEDNHAYSYVANDPMNLVDPSGMDPLSFAFSDDQFREVFMHNFEQTANTIKSIEEGLPGGPIIFEGWHDPNLVDYRLPENGIFRISMENLRGVGPAHYQEMADRVGIREYTDPDKDNPLIRDYFINIGAPYYADDDNKWCAACLSDTLRVTGNVYPTGEFGIRALNFAGEGYKPPEEAYGWDVIPGKEQVGDIVVVDSHVGYFAGRFSNGDILLLGGNQRNSVSFKVEGRDPVDIRRPVSLEQFFTLFEGLHKNRIYF